MPSSCVRSLFWPGIPIVSFLLNSHYPLSFAHVQVAVKLIYIILTPSSSLINSLLVFLSAYSSVPSSPHPLIQSYLRYLVSSPPCLLIPSSHHLIVSSSYRLLVRSSLLPPEKFGPWDWQRIFNVWGQQQQRPGSTHLLWRWPDRRDWFRLSPLPQKRRWQHGWLGRLRSRWDKRIM